MTKPLVKKLTGYITLDGKFHEREEDATKHQMVLLEEQAVRDFVQEIRKETGYVIPAESDLMRFIRKHPDRMITYVQKYFQDS